MNVLCYQPTQLLLTRQRKPLRNRLPTTKPKRAKRFKHFYCAVEKLGRTVGVEFTFIPGDMEKEDAAYVGSMAQALSPLYRRRLLARAGKTTFNNIGTDPDCIEVSTTKTKSRKAIRKAADMLHGVARDLGMVGHTDWHGGGGAHIHVGMAVKPGKQVWDNAVFTDPALKVLLLDATNRPYINWAFSNPGDNHNTGTSGHLLHQMDRHNGLPTRDSLTEEVQDAQRELDYAREQGRYYLKSYIRTAKAYVESGEWTRKRGLQYVREMYSGDEGCTIRRRKKSLKQAQAALAAYVEPVITGQRDNDRDYAYLLAQTGKHYGITPRACHGTLEFRIFQAPNDPAEHMLHLNFALAYVEWAESLAKAGMCPTACSKPQADIRAEWTLPKAQKAFLDFVSMIGLERNKYKRYAANMAKRFELVALDKGTLN